LVPQNTTTGKANRQKLTRKFVFEYRLEQRNTKSKSCSETQKDKGKKPVRSKQEDLQREASGPGPGPSTPLGNITKLVRDSASSKGAAPARQPTPSSAHFPANVPSAQPQPPRSPAHRQLSTKPLSQSSDDDRSLATRVAALEVEVKNLTEVHKADALWKKDLERWFLKQM
jgi:hypothetical protein